MSDSLKEWLTGELIRVGIDNANPENKVTMEEALANVAEVIAAAIDKGSAIVIKGSATIAEINAMDDMKEGDIWTCLDSGTIRNENADWLDVVAGDFVRYNGSEWELFLHLELGDYATKQDVEKVSASVAKVAEELSDHEKNYNNPHRVTADQLGAVTEDGLVEAITTHNNDDSAHEDIRKAISDEAATRESSDEEIITSLDDETTARRINDDLLQQQIEEASVQTDWNETDEGSLKYLANHPTPISDLDIEALFT